MSGTEVASAYAYLASVVRHKFIEGTLDEFCEKTTVSMDSRKAVVARQFLLLCAVQYQLWSGTILCTMRLCTDAK